MKNQRIQLLAIDIDGTLVQPDQTVHADVVDAIAQASLVGLRVCLATGRTVVESLPVWRQLRLVDPPEPMAVMSGALVAEPQTGRTLYQKPLPYEALTACAEGLRQTGRTVLGVVDAWRWGFDYLILPGEDYDDVQRRWLAPQRSARLRQIDSFDPAGPDVLRLNAILVDGEDGMLEASMRERFGHLLDLHEIMALNYDVRVFEAFASGANKWTAVRYIAQAYGLGAAAVAAIGDDVNDLAMLNGAGLGIAMPQASPRVRQSADRVATDGLAAAIRQLCKENGYAV